MIEIVWDFHVPQEHQERYEALYSSDGIWAKLFRKDPAYQGTKLLRQRGTKGRYFTVDRWSSHEAYHSFKERFAKEYAAIDQECEALTSSERLVGIFDLV